LQLDARLRWGLYAAFAALFVTGAVWLVGDAQKDSPNGEFWEALSANMLAIHGGAAMLTLVMLGALIPIHMQRSWRGQRNRTTGSVMVALNSALVLTAFGLYYAGSDVLRAWVSDIHIAIGLGFPLLLVIHIAIGRRNRRGSANAA
jgi:hypothetical protein